jgi:hypothetical protein
MGVGDGERDLGEGRIGLVANNRLRLRVYPVTDRHQVRCSRIQT